MINRVTVWRLLFAHAHLPKRSTKRCYAFALGKNTWTKNHLAIPQPDESSLT